MWYQGLGEVRLQKARHATGGILVSSGKMWGSQERLLSRGGTHSDLHVDPSLAVVWSQDWEWKKRRLRQAEAGAS